MRTRAKVDGNHAELVRALAQCGYLVLSLAPMGHGVPDLLTCRHGRLELLEVKAPKGKLTPAQEQFLRDGWPVRIVRGLGDVR